MADELRLGNLDARRDRGHARDYVRAMWLMLQQSQADDYVTATGRTNSIREFCRMAFNHVGLNWQDYVRTDEALLRPAEVDVLLGDASKARQQIGWLPRVPLEELVAETVDADIARNRVGMTT
jgi:GDPmannose 4,6-dehydratase